MKVVTFNIRCDYGQDGLNEFANRKELILRKINQEKPDIIGFQEVLPHVAKWLKENLNEYYVIGCGRGANLRDEQMSIAYRRDRINLISMETWWLSQTPDVPGSRYEEQNAVADFKPAFYKPCDYATLGHFNCICSNIAPLKACF